MVPVKVSLNIKDAHNREHLRLIVVAVMNVDETFEANVALCYLCVLSFLCFFCCLCMYVLRVYMCMFLLCSLLSVVIC